MTAHDNAFPHRFSQRGLSTDTLIIPTVRAHVETLKLFNCSKKIRPGYFNPFSHISQDTRWLPHKTFFKQRTVLPSICASDIHQCWNGISSSSSRKSTKHSQSQICLTVRAPSQGTLKLNLSDFFSHNTHMNTWSCLSLWSFKLGIVYSDRQCPPESQPRSLSSIGTWLRDGWGLFVLCGFNLQCFNPISHLEPREKVK